MRSRLGWGGGLGLLLLWGAGGCRSGTDKHLLYLDFEGEPAVVAGLSTEQAYSGSRAAKVIGPADTLLLRYPRLSLSASRHMRLSAQLWLARSSARYPPLVGEVYRQGVPIYRHELPLDEVVKRYDAWVPVTTLLRLPREVEPTDELRISLILNQPDTRVYLDDLALDDAE